MSNILIINAHQPYPFAQGQLNQTLVETATKILQSKGHQVRQSNVMDYDVQDELAKHQWADTIILQFPVYWMSVPYQAKKYMDDVYTAGMTGILCNTDGRHSANPTDNYGTGGTMNGKTYMLSATFNAPKQAFDKSDEYLFAGKGVDDLFFPIHCSFRFFAMEKLPTFACFDVMKNPNIEQDLKDFTAHIQTNF